LISFRFIAPTNHHILKMRRPPKDSPKKISPDSQRLIAFSQAMAQAASRVEERAWEQGMDALLQKLLKHAHQDAIDTALSHLSKDELNAYDALMESVEAISTSCVITREETGTTVKYDALLIAAPILAWTRFSIASGPIAPDILSMLSADLSAHLLAPDARMAMAPTLFAIDQLPHTHAEVFAFTQQLAHAALTGHEGKIPVNTMETAPFLADIRYLLAVVVAPSGTPLFHWQTMPSLLHFAADRAAALAQWRAQATPHIAGILPGCGLELLLPEAYFVACREADKQIRPISIRAAVYYLTQTLEVEPLELHAVIGSFGEETAEGQIDEYRISFTVRLNPEVVYGVVWPLFEPDDEESNAIEGMLQAGMTTATERKTPIKEILALLHEAGIIHIVCHDERFAMEYCDDCGAPLFADAECELVHAEMPEDTPQGNEHFH
jgi:hypothetical protein